MEDRVEAKFEKFLCPICNKLLTLDITDYLELASILIPDENHDSNWIACNNCGTAFKIRVKVEPTIDGKQLVTISYKGKTLNSSSYSFSLSDVVLEKQNEYIEMSQTEPLPPKYQDFGIKDEEEYEYGVKLIELDTKSDHYPTAITRYSRWGYVVGIIPGLILVDWFFTDTGFGWFMLLLLFTGMWWTRVILGILLYLSLIHI